MRFRLTDSGRFREEALDKDIVQYMSNYIRYPGDTIEEATIGASIDWHTSRYVWCRPCDVKNLYGKVDYEQYNSTRQITYNINNDKGRTISEGCIDCYHKTEDEQLREVTSVGSRATTCMITTSDYAMNIANGYFRGLGRAADRDAKAFRWLREYTIEDAKFKKWSNSDLASAFSDLADLMEKVGVRSDTYLCIRFLNQTIEASNEGVRKARQRKSAFSL